MTTYQWLLIVSALCAGAVIVLWLLFGGTTYTILFNKIPVCYDKSSGAAMKPTEFTCAWANTPDANCRNSTDCMNYTKEIQRCCEGGGIKRISRHSVVPTATYSCSENETGSSMKNIVMHMRCTPVVTA